MKWRYHFILILLVICFGIIVLRLFYWQIIRSQDLVALAQSQYGRVLDLLPQRGEIRTSDNFSFVTNDISYLVFANPKEVKEENKTIQLISSTLDLDVASVSASLSLDKFWVKLKSGVSSKDKDKIGELNLSGIGFESQFTRFYPEASLAAQLVGFVGKDDDGQDKGYFGLEGYYDRLLRGKEGKAIQIHDAVGRPILARMSDDSGQIDGSSLILSINRPIQYLVENRLKEGVEEYGATSGMVGIMDPKTGNIIAMASFPSFDPKNYQDYSDDLYKNPFISDTYEPGSTFKPIVMSAAFDANLITPKTTCNICAGPISMGGYTIHTWNDKYYPNMNMVDVILHSDNTGMVFVGKKLGLDKMISYLRKFGFDDLTGIDLQGEAEASLKPKNKWYEVDLATTSFGQGISVTPIQLLNAISTIANNGRRMEPHVVSAVESADGSIVKIEPKVLDQPIKSEVAKAMTEIMVNAVEKGEASWASLKGYRIAGKTGTASIPVAGHYDPTKTIASFIGFAPAEDPKFAMLVILDKPTTSIYGAETAAPLFFSIAKDILTYYRIAPKGQ